MERTATASLPMNFKAVCISYSVPLCVASDVAAKSVEFNSGDLGEAVRALMSFAFYLKPISVNGEEKTFDGGLYNVPFQCVTEFFS